MEIPGDDAALAHRRRTWLRLRYASLAMANPEGVRFSILYEIGRTLNSSLELSEVLELVMDSLIAVTRAERGFIMLDEGGELAVRVARNLDQRTIQAEAAQISRTITGQVAAQIGAERLPPVYVKSRREPVEVYRLVSVR